MQSEAHTCQDRPFNDARSQLTRITRYLPPGDGLQLCSHVQGREGSHAPSNRLASSWMPQQAANLRRLHVLKGWKHISDQLMTVGLPTEGCNP